jgi:hypothetical protein
MVKLENEAVFLKIVDFIEKNKYNDFGIFKKPLKLSRATTIENDLGITGDDANDFMADFSKTFEVNLEKFDPCCYFELEGFLYGLFMPFYSKAIKDCIRKKKRQITLGMLEQSVVDGIWDSDKIDKLSP